MPQTPSGTGFENPLLKERDDAARHARELVERCNNRLTIDDLDIAKRYIKGDLVIALNLGAAVSKENGLQIFVKSCALGRFNRIKSEPRPNLDRHVRAGDGHSNGDNFPVEVTVTDSVEGPQQLIPSVSVGLQLSHHRPGTVVKQLYLSLRSGAFVFLEVPCEWEVRPLGRVVAGMGGQVENKEVESRAKIRDGIAGDGGDDSRQGPREFDLQDAVLTIRLYRFNNKIGISAKEGCKPGMQVDDVMVGPFDL